MKITINNLWGSVDVELLCLGELVHRETFSGKATTYTRSVPADLVFDSHRAVMRDNQTNNFTYVLVA